MALGSCYTCIKYLMFAFNFIFWLLGCAILGVGIWLRVDDGAAEFMHRSPKLELFYTLAYIMMAIGFIIMVIGFLGCCGAIKESQCMLATFFIFLFIIFAALLSFGIWAVVAKDSFREMVEESLEEGVNDYNAEEQNSAARFMDAVQNFFGCCGASKGEEDYKEVSRIPESCSRDNYTQFDCCGWKEGRPDYKGDVPESCSEGRTQPCTNRMYDWVENKLVIIAGVAIGVAVVMILGMIFSMVLCCAIRDTLA